MTDQPRKRGGHEQVGGWYAGSFGWPDSEAGSSRMEERTRRRKLVERWLAPHGTPFTEILRSIAEGVGALGEAEVERTNGFLGLPSSTQYASNTIDLADQEIDRLALEREEYKEPEQAQGQQRPAQVAA